MDPIFANPPATLGLPFGVVLVGVAMAVMATGILALHRASSNRSALLAFVGLTLRSAAVVFASPALVLQLLDWAA
jgi:hypothetical protein